VSELSRSNFKKVLFIGIAVVVIAVSVVLASNWHDVAALYRPAPSTKIVQLNYANRVHGFSLKFPQYWVDYEPNTLETTASYIVRFTAPDVEGCDVPITITVMSPESPLPPGETLEGYFTKAEAGLKSTANNYERLNMVDVTVSGLPAKIVRWTMGDNRDLINDQAFFFYNNRVYIITYSALTEFHDQAFNGFELITSSFKFKQTSLPAVSPTVAP
jgi:hypothetical protein